MKKVTALVKMSFDFTEAIDQVNKERSVEGKPEMSDKQIIKYVQKDIADMDVVAKDLNPQIHIGNQQIIISAGQIWEDLEGGFWLVLVKDEGGFCKMGLLESGTKMHVDGFQRIKFQTYIPASLVRLMELRTPWFILGA